jgi:hydrogenase-4 component F
VILLLVLGLPLFGALLLAILGPRRYAADLNIAISFATLIAIVFLVLRILRHGPMLFMHEQFFVDSFNVFLVALTAFVGFTTALFSKPYMRIEEQRGRLNAARLRLYHSMYQVFMAAMYFVDGAAGFALPDARQPRGRMEIFHPLRRWHRASPVRNNSALPGS